MSPARTEALAGVLLAVLIGLAGAVVLVIGLSGGWR